MRPGLGTAALVPWFSTDPEKGSRFTQEHGKTTNAGARPRPTEHEPGTGSQFLSSEMFPGDNGPNSGHTKNSAQDVHVAEAPWALGIA